jgi:hypothetical protein
MIGIELKLKSKDSLVARIWHSMEFTLIKLCILRVSYL